MYVSCQYHSKQSNSSHIKRDVFVLDANSHASKNANLSRPKFPSLLQLHLPKQYLNLETSTNAKISESYDEQEKVQDHESTKSQGDISTQIAIVLFTARSRGAIPKIWTENRN